MRALMDTRARSDDKKSRSVRPGARHPAVPRLLNRLLAKAFAAFRTSGAPRDYLVFESLEPRVLLSGSPVAPPRIDGSPDVAGEVDRYSFTLTEDLRVVFDSLTHNGNMNWLLDGPRGNVVSPRPFSQAAVADLGGNIACDLPAGDYMPTVDGVGDTTGAYGFRLIDINRAQDLTPGTAVTGERSPANETDAHRFSVVAGQRFYFDRFSNSNDIYWRLLDPYGRTVTGPTSMGSDIGEMTLGLDGSHTLLIERRAYTTGTARYSFNVTRLVDPAPVAMALDPMVNGRIDQAGLRDAYTFTLDSEPRVLFDSLTNNSQLTWTLTGPTGTVVAGRSLQQSESFDIGGNPALTLAAGDYRLTIDGTADAVGNFAFRLLDFASATATTPGSPVSGTLGDAALYLPQMWPQTGAPITYPDGVTNASINFLGSAPDVVVGDSASLRMTSQMTIEARINPTGPGSDGTYGGIIVAKEGEYELARFADGSLQWAIANASPGWTWTNTGYVAPLNQWTHIAVTYDAGTVRTYADGVLVNTHTGSGNIGDVDSGRNAPEIGARQAGGQKFQGLIDEVRTWNVARTDAEIAAAHDRLLAGSKTGLVGHWRFDKGSGTTLAGASAMIETEAPLSGHYRATVAIVDRVVDSASRTFGVWLELPNPKGDIPARVKCGVALQ